MAGLESKVTEGGASASWIDMMNDVVSANWRKGSFEQAA